MDRRRDHKQASSLEEWELRVNSGQIYGKKGELEFTGDGKKVLCPLCGKELRVITHTHLKTHGLDISGDQFKKLMGLNRNQPLAASEFCELKRNQNHSLNLVRHIIPFMSPFHKGSDSRRMKNARLQIRKQRRQRILRRREERNPERGTKTGSRNKRKITPGGRICVLGHDYFFSKRKDLRGLEVTIAFEGDFLVASLTHGSENIVKKHRLKI